MLNKLSSELGETAFWAGIRRSVSTVPATRATSEHLRVSFEFSSGRDLKPFFQRWVYGVAFD